MRQRLGCVNSGKKRPRRWVSRNLALQLIIGWLQEICHGQACKLKFRLRELTSCLCSAAALAVCFEDCVADLDATETGNKLSQLNF